MEARAGNRDEGPHCNQAYLHATFFGSSRGLCVYFGGSCGSRWWNKVTVYVHREKIHNKIVRLQFTLGSETLHKTTHEQYEILNNNNKTANF